MIDHDAVAEKAFLREFDFNFPYGDAQAARGLLERGWSISLNATFCVLNEICRAPFEGVVTPDRQLELLEQWCSGFMHPLKEPLTRCALALIKGEYLPWRESAEIMRIVGEYPAQRAALGIAYSAGYTDDDDGEAYIAELGDAIRQAWDSQGC